MASLSLSTDSWKLWSAAAHSYHRESVIEFDISGILVAVLDIRVRNTRDNSSCVCFSNFGEKARKFHLKKPTSTSKCAAMRRRNFFLFVMEIRSRLATEGKINNRHWSINLIDFFLFRSHPVDMNETLCVSMDQLTWTSNEKYFFRFLMIITRYGSLMPSVFFGSDGHVMKVVETFDEMISSTSDWMSLSVMRLMWPFRTYGRFTFII